MTVRRVETEAGVSRFATISPAAFHIGLALVAGPAHGYRIMATVKELTGGETHLGPGTLYRTLAWMNDSGLIDEVPAPGYGSDARRRPYRLTTDGHAAIEAEARRLARLVELARTAGFDVN